MLALNALARAVFHCKRIAAHPMTNQSDPLKPFERLALAYAEPALSEALLLLLLCDRRLQEVALKGQEPLLAQMRVVWWREQFSKPADVRAKGEPLLGLISQTDKLSPHLRLIEIASELANAWEELAANPEPETQEVIEQHLTIRANAVFGAYANWSGASQSLVTTTEKAGRFWAAGTIGLKVGDNLHEKIGIKPLDILVFGTKAELETAAPKRMLGAMRLGFHALTGL